VIALTGATGFVGGRLLERLRADGEDVRTLSRHPEGDQVRADVLEPETLGPALDGVEIAYYLVHAIGDAGAFDETEAEGARNFARAASEQGVERIVYLGGLAHGDDLSDHMRSRQEVGRLLGETGVDVVELRASIVIGEGSLSWQLVQEIVDASPVLPLPNWIDTHTQPIAVDDLVDYLVAARDVAPGVYEIGGADVLTYRELIAAYGDAVGKGTVQVGVPVLGSMPQLVTDLLPERARASLHLVESLRFDSTVRDRAADAFGLSPVGVREAIRRALAAPR
jgi:uncharacterized protein YbjT (DUF2867 family)